MARRLSAILAADVVGYSSLMAENEAETLAALRAHRADLFDPETKRHGGRIVKLIGDGTLVEFNSVVEAVECAIAVQTALAQQGGPIRLRIGINLGDVIVEDGDIYGDGVNIAARLESLAESGGICLSGDAYRQVRGKTKATFRDAGLQRLKNIAELVQVYRWSLGGEAPARTGPITMEKPSIAVLPFANLSGDHEQEYFADGITEDLITALGRCRWLLVIARNSTFAYKGKPTDIRQISQELGVRYAVEGSVRKSGNRIRVTAQVIDGRDGTRLWGERYDRQLDDVFALQEEITERIAGTIAPELEAFERFAVRARASVDQSAWDCYQRGQWHLYRFSAEELETAQAYFERAITLDQGFSQAYARLAYVQIQLGWYGSRGERAARVEEATSFAKRAVEIDGRDPSARLSLGRALFLSGEMESGIEELRAAVALDQSFAQAHFALAQALTGVDRHEEALREIDTAIQLSPRDPHMWTFLHIRAIAHYIAGDLDQAVADEHAALRQPNVTFYPYTLLVAAYGRAGKTAEAREAVAALRRLRPGFNCAEAIGEWHFGNNAVMTDRFLDQFAADIRKAGVNQHRIGAPPTETLRD